MKRYFLSAVLILFASLSFGQINQGMIGGGGSGSGVQTDTNCNQAKYFTIGTLCQDTDDGKLYKGTGAAIEEITAAAGSFLTTAQLDDTKGNGDTGFIWSADKVFDQLALKFTLASDTNTIGSGTGPVVLTFSVTGIDPTLTVDTNGFTFSKPVLFTKVSGTAGLLSAYEANSTDTSYIGWMGPASISESFSYQFSNTQPAAGQVMVFAVPTGTGDPNGNKVSAQTWLTPLSASAPALIDGSAGTGPTAAQMADPRCHVTNFGQAAADVAVALPTCAANLSCLFTVGTAQSNKWGVQAGASDKIYLIAADGTIAAGTDNGFARMTAAQVGQAFTCWSFQTGASAWDWECKAIAIGTSTFAAN